MYIYGLFASIKQVVDHNLYVNITRISTNNKLFGRDTINSNKSNMMAVAQNQNDLKFQTSA